MSGRSSSAAGEPVHVKGPLTPPVGLTSHVGLTQLAARGTLLPLQPPPSRRHSSAYPRMDAVAKDAEILVLRTRSPPSLRVFSQTRRLHFRSLDGPLRSQ